MVFYSRKSDADAVFLLGIARHAQPLDHLQSKHTEFQKRMMSSITMPPPPVPEPSTRRTALGMTASSSSGPFGRGRAPSSSQDEVLGSGSRTVSNSRLQIFVDPTGSEPQEESPRSYPDIGTRKSRVKENVPEVQKAAGTILKNAGRARRVTSGSSALGTNTESTSKIVPYRDPGPGEFADGEFMPAPLTTKLPPKTPARNASMVPFRDPGCPDSCIPCTPRFTPFRDEPKTPGTSTGLVAPETVMKPKVAGKGIAVLSEAEALRKDPLKNYSVDECHLVDD
ncbi:hypothetical protein J3R83DRAFT_9749 [Lanmaoa asiatica]|nr:hypothetical protein J3R83DRAFT_9749 [Lanmaoa asiatica]